MDELGPGLLDELEPMVPALRLGTQPWQATVPVGRLRSQVFPTVVVSGRHDRAFHAVCEAVARDVGARLVVVEGAGHEVQAVPDRFNAVLREAWAHALPLRPPTPPPRRGRPGARTGGERG